MTTPINADPMTVYLLIEGEEPVAVPGIVDFNLTVENPEVNEEPRRYPPGQPAPGAATAAAAAGQPGAI